MSPSRRHSTSAETAASRSRARPPQLLKQPEFAMDRSHPSPRAQVSRSSCKLERERRSGTISHQKRNGIAPDSASARLNPIRQLKHHNAGHTSSASNHSEYAMPGCAESQQVTCKASGASRASCCKIAWVDWTNGSRATSHWNADALGSAARDACNCS